MKRISNAQSEASDEQLMSAITQGERPAFDELYKRYHRRLYYYFYKMLSRDEEKAQDFLQEIFLKVAEKPRLFNPSMRFSTWIFSVAFNMCKNEYRRLHVRRIEERGHDPEMMPCQAVSFDGTLDTKRFLEALETELGGLDEDHRTTFVLRFKENFSIKEIGKTLACPEGTVKSRLHYTIKKLAGKLHAFQPE